jgi:hypothetical protein
MEAFNTTIYYESDLLQFTDLMKQVDQRRPGRWIDSKTHTHLEFREVECAVGRGWELGTGDRRAGITAVGISETRTRITFADGRPPEGGEYPPIGEAFAGLYKKIKDINCGRIQSRAFPGTIDVFCERVEFLFEKYMKWPQEDIHKQLQVFYEKCPSPPSEGLWGIWAESRSEAGLRWATIRARSQPDSTTLVDFIDGYHPGSPDEILARPIGPMFEEIRAIVGFSVWPRQLDSVPADESQAEASFFEKETLLIDTSRYGDETALRFVRWISDYTGRPEHILGQFPKGEFYYKLDPVPRPTVVYEDEMVYIPGRVYRKDGTYVGSMEPQWLIRFWIWASSTPYMHVVCQCREPALKEYYAQMVRDIKRQWPHLEEDAGAEETTELTAEKDRSGQRGGRRPLTDEEWQRRREQVEKIIQRSIKRGTSERLACENEGVAYSTFRDWKRKLNM